MASRAGCSASGLQDAKDAKDATTAVYIGTTWAPNEPPPPLPSPARPRTPDSRVVGGQSKVEIGEIGIGMTGDCDMVPSKTGSLPMRD